MSVNVFNAKRYYRDGLALLSGEPSDEALNRSLDAAIAAQGFLAAELSARKAERVVAHRQQVTLAALKSMGPARTRLELPERSVVHA